MEKNDIYRLQRSHIWGGLVLYWFVCGIGADEVIAHLVGLVGAKVKVTLEIEAEIPPGVSANVVRTVTENSRTLKFTSQGFEVE